LHHLIGQQKFNKFDLKTAKLIQEVENNRILLMPTVPNLEPHNQLINIIANSHTT